MSTTELALRHAPGPSAGHFFRHHGVWAPGVRLFRRLQFGAKAGWISLAFLLPLLWLLQAYLHSSQGTIDFALNERAGVAVIRQLEPWLAEVQRQRRLVRAGEARQPDLGALGELAEQARRSVLAVSAQSQLLPELERVMQWHEKLGTPDSAESSEALGQVFQSYVEALRDLRITVMDQSQLTLDPDQDTYYLGLLSTELVSAAIETISLSRAMAGALAHRGLSAESGLRPLYGVWFEGREHVSQIEKAVRRGAEANPALRSQLRVEAAAQATRAFLAQAETMWFGPVFEADLQDLNGPGQAAVDRLRELALGSMGLLDSLLQQRIERTERERRLLLGGLGACLCVAAYLFYAFFLVMSGGLHELSRHLEAMTAGDLTTSPHPWGRDEAARLMNLLRGMQDSLRGMVSHVREASDQIVHSSAEIASGSMDLSSRTEQTAANLQQAAAAMEEIGSTVRQSTQHTQEATRVAAENAHVAGQGGQVIGNMVATMEDIQNASRRIEDIIGVIDGIAFQTNILALNAAVEAARAGEQGRGFAVVAGEVRSLAQRAATAAREIKALIASSVGRVASGTAVVREAGSTMQAIVASAGRVSELLGYIASGAAEQSQAIVQVSDSVQALDRATQQNAALVEQAAAGAAALREQAGLLAQEVDRFRMP